MKIADVRGWGKAVVGVMQMFSTLLEAETLRFMLFRISKINFLTKKVRDIIPDLN